MMHTIYLVNVRDSARKVQETLTSIASKLETMQGREQAVVRGDPPSTSSSPVYYTSHADTSGTPANLAGLAGQFAKLGGEIENLFNSLASDVNTVATSTYSAARERIDEVERASIDLKDFYRRIPASVIFRRSNGDLSRSFTSAVEFLHEMSDRLQVDIKLIATALEYHFFGHDALAIRHLRTGGVSSDLSESIVAEFMGRFPRNAVEGAKRG